MNIQLLINNKNELIEPVVVDDISWELSRKGTPGKLTFAVVGDVGEEGDAVRLTVNGVNCFYGFIFEKQTDKNKINKLVAYDQLRYLKNKDTYVYENKTASELIKMIASDFRLNTGTIADTKYKIESRIEDNQTLFDIIQSALDITLTNTKQMYVLYDDFGKLSLSNVNDMKLDIIIDETTAEDYSYSSSINSETYNKIKLVKNVNDKRDVYIAQDSNNINRWGVLQYYESIDENGDGKNQADSLLKLYNQKTKKLEIKNALGDIRARAGSLIVTMLQINEDKIYQYMLVEKIKHNFKNGHHTMNLSLRGGEFV